MKAWIRIRNLDPESESGCAIRSGSTFLCLQDPDPDPPKNIMHPQHCLHLHPFYSVRQKKRGKVGKLPTTVPEFVRRGVPEVYKRTAGKEPFLR